MFYEVAGDKSNKQQEEYRKINNAYNEKLAKTQNLNSLLLNPDHKKLKRKIKFKKRKR